MHGVKKDLNLKPFVGESLDHIGLGMHQIHFVLSGGCSLTVEGHWEIEDSNGDILDCGLKPEQKPYDREYYRVHLCLGRGVHPHCNRRFKTIRIISN